MEPVMASETKIAAYRGAEQPADTAEARADNLGKRIGILIVAYNAVSTLAGVFRRIKPEVWKNVEEVVVFDDASQDSTYELAVGYKILQEMTKLNVIQN